MVTLRRYAQRSCSIRGKRLAQGHTHAADGQDGGGEDEQAAADEAFFGTSSKEPPPTLAEVYLSDTRILHALKGRDRPDKKPERPVVVVRAPSRTYPRVNVCGRQSMKPGQRNPDGVPHAADRSLNLDVPGVWLPGVKFATIEDFAGEAVEYLGVLDEGVFTRVMKMVARGQA